MTKEWSNTKEKWTQCYEIIYNMNICYNNFKIDIESDAELLINFFYINSKIIIYIVKVVQ